MTIYIYGSDSFKNEINEVLRHSNIKFRLDSKGEVKELNTLNELKAAIEENPNNIYLIDDSKIIKKNIFTDKISFLKPKDGIEQEYLLDHGIGDVSVDSIDELSKHIIRRLDSVVDKEEDIDNIQDSIIEIVEDAYDEDSNLSIGDNEDYVELDDELSALLSSSREEDDTFFEEESSQNDAEVLADILNEAEKNDFEETEFNKNESQEEIDSSSSLDDLLMQLEESHNQQLDDSQSENSSSEIEDFGELQDVLEQIEENEIKETKPEANTLDPLEGLSFDENLDKINTNTKSNKEEKIEFNTQGEQMSDQFSEFDTLSEDEILAALSGVENVTVEKSSENNKKNVETKPAKVNSNSSDSLDIQSANSDEIAKLITQLLNNKTLEITIKVKD